MYMPKMVVDISNEWAKKKIQVSGVWFEGGGTHFFFFFFFFFYIFFFFFLN